MPKTQLLLSQVINKTATFRRPRVIAFNRLEASPRTRDFSRSLRAEVRDPLWMLTRQWQFGEFKGEDAASPVTSRIAYRHHTVDRLALRDGAAFEFDPATMPLETRVEREPVQFTLRELANGQVFSDVLFAVQWGKQLLRMLRSAGLDTHYPLYLQKFPIRVLPPEPAAGEPARRTQDPGAEHIRMSVAGRVADGVAIWRAVESGAHDVWLKGEPGGDKPALKGIAAAFATACASKVGRLFTQPAAPTDSAWVPNHLEYRFAVGTQPSADDSMPVLLAEQYHQGHLDWYSFDSVSNRSLPMKPEPPPRPEPEQVESFLPAPVRFKGQPQPRFWQMEETRTDFGKIETSTTGLLHLLLAEFGLIYSNDWFTLPHPMKMNTVCEINGIVVDDTFGRHTFIRPAGRGPETEWQRFAMFHMTERERRGPVVTRFYLVPAVGKVLKSQPLERVNFMRDEMANMAWGVESIVPSQAGIGMSGYEAFRPNPTAPARVMEDDDVKLGYLLGTTVPPNWIPFIPVHAEGSVSEIRLQRARTAGGQPPRSRLLREPGSPYFVEEEEVARAGIYVERTWQRARWIQGRTLIWIGRQKSAGRGEGSSNFVFDKIVDLQKMS